MANINFKQPFLQSSVSHDPSEIIPIYWFGAQDAFLIIIDVKTVFAAKHFCGDWCKFRGRYDWKKVTKNKLY